MDICKPSTLDRRKNFWTTQSCDVFYNCNDECGIFGLVYDGDGGLDPSENPRSIKTNNWLSSLVVNILLTDGRQSETPCGFAPGRRGGHWSDSFRTDGLTSGSLIRNPSAAKTVQEAALLLEAYAQVALQKLVTLGVALSVKATATYSGKNRIQLGVVITGPASAEERVGLTTTRLTNQRVWNK